MATLILFSGGLDSTVTLFKALYDGHKVYGLTFDYGQNHIRELDAARRIWTFAKYCNREPTVTPAVQEHKIIHLHDNQLPRGHSSLLGGGPIIQYDRVPDENTSRADSAFIPYRNLIFLSIAAAWAQHFKCDRILTGLRGGYPDCTPHFEMAVSDILEMSDPSWPLTVWSPVHLSRTETIQMAKQIPHCWEALAHTLTCFAGTEPPCGKCLPCMKRAEGFANVGLQDPLLERLREESGVGS